MEKLVDLHNDIMFFLIVIVSFVAWMLLQIMENFSVVHGPDSLRVSFSHHTLLEKVWTYIPAAILLSIAVPSFALLYVMDHFPEADLTVKIIGNQ